ncbi:Serine/threonine-protein kinase 38-like [Xenotaenia resolanae]|uniref:Serine/threonine-protein kinase 38-like n=1 Tax=Xenotaenia resolanae TaxID=208358 RepID=A0ABV0WJA9_9TELE
MAGEQMKLGPISGLQGLFNVFDSMAMTGGTAAALPMSNHTRERVTVAKLTLENFYSTLLTQHEEREMR